MLMLLGHPSFIFAKINCRDHMMESAPNGSLVTLSGWMTSELFPEVFKQFDYAICLHARHGYIEHSFLYLDIMVFFLYICTKP